MEEYMYYGIRTQEVDFEQVGDTMIHESVVWCDGEETETSLNGVSCLDLSKYDSIEDAIKASTSGYFGWHTAIIGSDEMMRGEDENELVLRDPVVVQVIR